MPKVCRSRPGCSEQPYKKIKYSTAVGKESDKMPGTAEDQTFRFLLLGKTGSGKSSTGNTILGQDLFDSEVSFVAVTDQCQLKSATRNGAKIEIMDSPGLFDPEMDQEVVSALIMQAIACMHPGPDAVLYVIKIGRYTEEEFAVYNRLKALLDENVTKYMVVVFTFGDSLKGRDVREIIGNLPPTLKQVLDECSHRYEVFDNSGKAEKEPQTLRLLETVKRLRERNGHVPYACPKYAFVAEEMERELSRRLEKVEEKELENKKHVAELTSKLHEVEDAVAKEKVELDRKDLERQEAMKQRQMAMKQEIDSLALALKMQQASEEEEKKRTQELKARLDQEKRDFEKRMEQQRQEQAELLRRKEEERQKAEQKLREEKEAAEKAAEEKRAREAEALRQQIAAQRAAEQIQAAQVASMRALMSMRFF